MLYTRIKPKKLSVCLAVLGFMVSAAAQEAEVTNITVSEAHDMWLAGVPVLDVRSVSEFESGHVPGAMNINVTELADRISELEEFRDTDLIVCCGVGSRSATASALLAGEGFTGIHNMLNGLTAWRDAGFEVEEGGEGEGEGEDPAGCQGGGEGCVLCQLGDGILVWLTLLGFLMSTFGKSSEE